MDFSWPTPVCAETIGLQLKKTSSFCSDSFYSSPKLMEASNLGDFIIHPPVNDNLTHSPLASDYHGKRSPFQPAKVPDPFSFVAASIYCTVRIHLLNIQRKCI